MTRMIRPRVFLFGIDGADWQIIDRLIARGILPHLARFRGEAAHAPLRCTQPAHTAPGWASLMTGRYPGGHGVFQFFHTQEPGYRGRITTSADVGTSTMFDWLARQGWQCGVVNMPMTHPPRKLPGYQITWPLANTLRFSDPPDLLGELARTGAPFRSDLACMYRGDLAYIDEAIANIAARAESVKQLMRTRPVDFVAMVITETDRVSHHYWHFSDPSHPLHPAEADPAHRRAIEDCYAAVDRVFGELLALLPDETTVLVVSDHGSGAGYDDLSLNRLLAEADLLALQSTSAPAPVASWFSDGDQTVDWSRTRVYSPVPGSFGINVNQKGRQLSGTVEEADADALLTELTAWLRTISSPRSGRPVFRDVVRATDLHPGPFVRLAPDLILIPEDETTILSAHVTGALWRPSYQTGLHRFEGVWMQRSPQVIAGALATPMHIVEVAPTLLADAGALSPMASAARSEILRSGPAAALTLESDDAGSADADYEEDPLVSQQLRAMGYL